jgi:hypothetical protein
MLYIRESQFYPGDWGVYDSTKKNKVGGEWCLVFGLTKKQANQWIEENGDRLCR